MHSSNELTISSVNLKDRLEKHNPKTQQQEKQKKDIENKTASKLVKNFNQVEKVKAKVVAKKKNDEEAEERQKVIWKIRRYIASKRFGEYISKELGIKYTQAQLQKLKLNTLQNILHRIRISIDLKNTDSIMDKFAFGASMMTEMAVSPFYDIEGTTEVLFENDDFLNALEKVKIETDVPNIPPPIQLSLIGVQTALVVHQRNTFVKKRNVPQKNQDIVITDKDDKNEKKNELNEPVREMRPPTIQLGEIL